MSTSQTKLIHTISREVGITKQKAEQTLHVIADTVKAQLSAGENVRLYGIGTLYVKTRAARVIKCFIPGRFNEKVLPERKAVTFKPHLAMTSAVRGE